MSLGSRLVSADVYAIDDTCVVYLIVDRQARTAVAVDVGSGRWLKQLPEFGADSVTDVIVTHHHRDQVEGLPLLAATGTRIWVPPIEQQLIDDVEEHWQRRPVVNNYDVRLDRFSLLASVPVTGTMPEYRTRRVGHVDVTTLPTPGHTIGSVTYLVEAADRRLAFTGDLIHSPGKVWSAAALQWSYVGLEGAALTMASLAQLLEHHPDVLLPSHGEPMTDPRSAVALTNTHLSELIEVRLGFQPDMLGRLAKPFVELSPHLLMNATSESRSYVLLSDAGTALLIDYGYDLSTGIPVGGERFGARPWLPSLTALRRDYGVERVEVAIPTHYHDDHVAAFNLLRDVHGTEVWAGGRVAQVLEHPEAYDLPCLWYDPIPCERHVPDGGTVQWREYELGIHALPGHTRYASAISFEVDGRRVLATGDQQTGTWVPDELPEIPNFQYANEFRADDFLRSAKLYQRLQPQLLLTGHWQPRRVSAAYLDHLNQLGEDVARVHRQLLLPHDGVFGEQGRAVRITPYRTEAVTGKSFDVRVLVTSGYRDEGDVRVELTVPAGWSCEPADQLVTGPAGADFTVLPQADEPVRRARIAVGLTVGGRYLGQQAEALVDVRS